DPLLRGGDIAERLNETQSLYDAEAPGQLLALHGQARALHQTDHRDLLDWLGQVRTLAPKQDIGATYRAIYAIRRAVEIYAGLLDRGPEALTATRLIQSLQQVETELQKSAHPQAAEIAAVEDLDRDLPGLARRLLSELHDLKTVGPNTATLETARDLKD